MYMIYWTEEGQPKGQQFDSEEMGAALKFSEGLRKRSFAGEDIHFIVMSAENPNCVGKMGVDVTGPDYDWKKRRI